MHGGWFNDRPNKLEIYEDDGLKLIDAVTLTTREENICGLDGKQTCKVSGSSPSAKISRAVFTTNIKQKYKNFKIVLTGGWYGNTWFVVHKIIVNYSNIPG